VYSVDLPALSFYLAATNTKLGLNEETSTVHGESYKLDKRESYLVNTIDHILKNHSGIGLETFKLACASIDAHYLDSWLQTAVTPGIEELSLRPYKKYSFPCSVLSGGLEIQFGLLIFTLVPSIPRLNLAP